MFQLHNKALLAPMSGITDLPFRRLAHRLGAGLVVAEMAAEKLINASHDGTLRRIAASDDIRPHVVQIMGRDPLAMAEAARIAIDCGADMVDVNFGCPARKVVGGQAGAALLREPDVALQIVDAVASAVDVPVSLKLRLGWDEQSRNAALIARRAESAGVGMFFVHGRTRNQFYSGKADWEGIGEVVAAVNAPVFANGDIRQLADVDASLAASGAYGVMIGRGALGRPWFLGDVAGHIDGAPPIARPDVEQQKQIVIGHYEDMLGHYGSEFGLRVARKHLGWYVDELHKDQQSRAVWRLRLCQEDCASRVVRGIREMYDMVASAYRLAS